MSGKIARALRKYVARYPASVQKKLYRKLKNQYIKGKIKFKDV